MEYFIYMLRCKNDSLYTGIAIDYEKRFEEHINGKGAKYTRAYKVKSIERIFIAKNRSEASIIESYIKKKSKKEKENILKDPNKFIENVKKIKNIEIILKKRKKV